MNVLCHKSLLAAYGEGAFGIERRHVRESVMDTDGLRPAFSSGWRRFVSGLFTGRAHPGVDRQPVPTEGPRETEHRA